MLSSPGFGSLTCPQWPLSCCWGCRPSGCCVGWILSVLPGFPSSSCWVRWRLRFVFLGVPGCSHGLQTLVGPVNTANWVSGSPLTSLLSEDRLLFLVNEGFQTGSARFVFYKSRDQLRRPAPEPRNVQPSGQSSAFLTGGVPTAVQ